MGTGRLTGQQITAAMQRLPQAAAAWLLNLSSRSARDHVEIPRNDDGTYNARALVAWARDHIQRAELDDEDCERALLVAEELGFHLPSATAEILDGLRAKYGDGGLLAYLDIQLAHLRELAAPPPVEPTVEALKDAEQNAIERLHEQYARSVLRVAVVCEGCRCLRRGRSWVKANPPAGFAVTLGGCPRCEAAEQQGKPDR